MAPRGRKLTESEVRQILALKTRNVSTPEIARRLGRSPGVIYNLLKNPEGYGQKNPGGRPPVLSRRDRSAVLRRVSATGCSARQALVATEVPASVRTIQRLLQQSPNHVWKHMGKKPELKPHHLEARKKFGRENMATDWTRVIFSDEKKFNLDGPDGLKVYWHDLRHEPKTLFSRQSGGGSVMVWAGFAAGGKTSLAILQGRQDAQAYIWTLQNHLLPDAPLIASANWIFQQDNASIHTAGVVKEFFREWEMTVLEWPAKSPDLNPIENLWGIMVRRLYCDAQGTFRQFETVEALSSEIRAVWDSISLEELKTLTDSMPNRIYDVIRADGKPTNY